MGTLLRIAQACGDEPWLTRELMVAYYVALSVDPEIRHAPAVVRASTVDLVIAGLRASRSDADALDAKGRDQCLALMRQDHAATEGRRW